MLSIEENNFISEKMKIDISSIENKLDEQKINDYKEQIVAAITYFIAVIIEYELSGDTHDIYSVVPNRAEKSINDYAENLSSEINSEATRQVVDTLRHAFSCYAYNGLHQLYTRQENEGWYPRIILTEVLEPNDIHTLEEDIELYRGCNVDEYNKQIYGQAWTTSLDIAKMFAFKNYAGQHWFNESRRVVLKTIYKKENVLFSDQKIEHEVTVNTGKLRNVQTCI